MMKLLSSLIMLSGLWVFCSKRKHLLLTLLSLEYMVLGIFLAFFIPMKMGMLFYSLFYLVMSACEGALGLSILVTMSRTHYGDSFSLFNINYDKIYFSIYNIVNY